MLYCRGIDPIMPFGLFRGVDQGGWDPNEFKFNTYTIVIGAQTLHATGYAMGITMDGKTGTPDGEAVIAYFGDGATAQGDVNEAFVFAAVQNAPVVFFCQNNQWAISEPSERQTRIPLYQRAKGFGFPGVRVDGNDVLASYAVTKAALQRARDGQGPTLVEAYTYRMGAHTTSDDPTKYRLSEDLEHWKLKDPIERVRAYLTRTAGVDHDYFDQVALAGVATLPGLPATAFPIGSSAEGLSIGVQAIGPMYEDRTPIRFAELAASFNARSICTFDPCLYSRSAGLRPTEPSAPRTIFSTFICASRSLASQCCFKSAPRSYELIASSSLLSPRSSFFTKS